jgi:ribosomal protein S18 acetylase RimI-like enzyme
MDEIIFRPALSADLASIIALLADDRLGRAREDSSDPPAPCYVAAFAAIERDPNQTLVVAERGGAVVGSLQLSFLAGLSHRGAWRGQIEGVRIAASERGAGLGRRMIEWAIEACRARGCRLVQLTSDKTRADAIRFYQSLGFKPSHEGMKLAL